MIYNRSLQHITLDANSCGPTPNFQNFHNQHQKVKRKSTIMKPLIFRRFILQVSIRTMCFHLEDSLNLSYIIQKVVTMFGTLWCCELLFFKMKHAMSTLHLQLSNNHLFDMFLQSTSSLNICKQKGVIDITFFNDSKQWGVSLINYDCYFMNLAILGVGRGLSFEDHSPRPSRVKICGSQDEKVGDF